MKILEKIVKEKKYKLIDEYIKTQGISSVHLTIMGFSDLMYYSIYTKDLKLAKILLQNNFSIDRPKQRDSSYLSYLLVQKNIEEDILIKFLDLFIKENKCEINRLQIVNSQLNKYEMKKVNLYILSIINGNKNIIKYVLDLKKSSKSLLEYNILELIINSNNINLLEEIINQTIKIPTDIKENFKKFEYKTAQLILNNETEINIELLIEFLVRIGYKFDNEDKVEKTLMHQIIDQIDQKQNVQKNIQILEYISYQYQLDLEKIYNDDKTIIQYLNEKKNINTMIKRIIQSTITFT